MGLSKGPADGEREPDKQPGQRRAEREARDWSEETGYRPGVNQRRHEPMPASHDDERRQEAVVRNEQHAAGHARARPSRRARRRGGE